MTTRRWSPGHPSSIPCRYKPPRQSACRYLILQGAVKWYVIVCILHSKWFLIIPIPRLSRDCSRTPYISSRAYLSFISSTSGHLKPEVHRLWLIFLQNDVVYSNYKSCGRSLIVWTRERCVVYHPQMIAPIKDNYRTANQESNKRSEPYVLYTHSAIAKEETSFSVIIAPLSVPKILWTIWQWLSLKDML